MLNDSQVLKRPEATVPMQDALLGTSFLSAVPVSYRKLHGSYRKLNSIPGERVTPALTCTMTSLKN